MNVSRAAHNFRESFVKTSRQALVFIEPGVLWFVGGINPEAEIIPESDIYEYDLNTGLGRYVEGTVEFSVWMRAQAAMGNNKTKEVH